MRTRDKQRIFRRFMAGESLGQLTYKIVNKPRPELLSSAMFIEASNLVKSIIREGVTKGWPTGLEKKGTK